MHLWSASHSNAPLWGEPDPEPECNGTRLEQRRFRPANSESVVGKPEGKNRSRSYAATELQPVWLLKPQVLRVCVLEFTTVGDAPFNGDASPFAPETTLTVPQMKSDGFNSGVPTKVIDATDTAERRKECSGVDC